MRINKFFLIIILSCFSLGNFQLNASTSTIKVKLDSTILMMGKITNLQVEVTHNKNVKGRFPLFDQISEKGYVSVCGDSVELRAPSKIDTIEENDKLKISFSLPLQCFDSGYYKLPELQFIADKDTAYSNSLALKVVPVLAEANDPIDDYANVSDPENQSIFDYIPDWIIHYWWIILIAILIIATLIYLYYRYKTEGTILKKKPLPTPYEIAQACLKNLKEKKLWEQGLEKEYYTELTDILRQYLYGRFGLNAMEMTSRQIMSKLKNIEEAKEQRKYFRKILDMADFVKFAKVRPLPEDNVESMENAMKFVESTKPIPVLEEEGNSADSQNVIKDKDAESKKGGLK